MDNPEESPLRKPMITIQKSGEKASAIVQDLLTLARRGVSVMEVMNFNPIITEYLRSPEYKKLQLNHPNVQVKLHLESPYQHHCTHFQGNGKLHQNEGIIHPGSQYYIFEPWLFRRCATARFGCVPGMAIPARTATVSFHRTGNAGGIRKRPAGFGGIPQRVSR